MTQSIAAATQPKRRKPLKWGVISDHAILILGALVMILPIVIALTTATLPDIQIEREGLQLSIGDQFDDNIDAALNKPGGFSGEVTGTTMLWNSLILGIGFAVGKIIVGMMAAYAIVYFRLRFGTFAFWIIFTTLLLPLEVRILPSYEVIVGMGLTDTYTGLIVPLIASATATFFFRQFFLSVPEELVEAARIDGAGPAKFFIDILVPLSRTMIAAMFIIMFVFGWNQYLWPTLITTEESMFTLVRGIRQIIQDQEGANIPEYGRGIMLAMLAMAPPVLIVVFFQSWFVKGLTESDK